MNTITSFKLAVSRAQKQSRAIRAVLRMNNVPACEIAPLLRTGWLQIKHAVDLINLSDQDSKVAALQNAASTSLAWLDSMITDDDCLHSIAVSQKWFDAARQFDEAIWSLRKWRRSHMASGFSKLAHTLYIVNIATLGIGAILLFFTGIYSVARAPKPYQGLSATYFTRPNFSGHPFSRVEHFVNFNWNEGAPLRGVPKRGFSLRLEGCLVVEPDSPIFLAAGSSSPLRVYLDENLIIEKTATKVFELENWRQKLTGGIYKIRLEYLSLKVPGRAVLFKSSEVSTEPEIIPADALVPLGGNASHACPSHNSIEKNVL
ncbi:MAG: hypothetical protein GY854_32375 [Deltaproteobacteria bacterium]|nr:hypothetical protein [Deltaproteobacteria bacterium]